MFLPKRAATILCVAGALGAQTPVDLNGLAVAASHYVSHGLQGQAHAPALDLRLLRGDNGGDAVHLMSAAADVVRWTLFYNASYGRPALQEDLALPVQEDLTLARSASAKCCKGTFSDFLLAKAPIPASKSMEFTWLAVTLDAAIARLNANGYVRGFSQVEVKKPDVPGLSDESVYIFTCPWERTKVAISANNGAFVWYQMF